MDENDQVIGVATLLSIEGQNLNFAIAVEKLSAALVQLPGEQFSRPVAPPAPPTPAIGAKASYDKGMALYSRKEYDGAIGDFTEAIRLDPHFALP